LATTN